jgi:hypothetical protein
VNASLALIEGAKPQGEIEAALVLQMACTHAAASVTSAIQTIQNGSKSMTEDIGTIRKGRMVA